MARRCSHGATLRFDGRVLRPAATLSVCDCRNPYVLAEARVWLGTCGVQRCASCMSRGMWYAVRIAAAPGSGNAAFTAATQSKIANRFHFVYKADLVPCLPTYVGYPEPQPYRCVPTAGLASNVRLNPSYPTPLRWRRKAAVWCRMRANKCTGDWFECAATFDHLRRSSACQCHRLSRPAAHSTAAAAAHFCCSGRAYKRRPRLPCVQLQLRGRHLVRAADRWAVVG